MHFRGPLHLKQFAAYKLNPSKKRETTHARRHGHQHFHKRNAEAAPEEAIEERGEEKRQMISATIDGKVVSWMNNWFGGAASPTPAASSAQSTAPAAAAPQSTGASDNSDTKSAAVDSTPGDYARIGYYNAASHTKDGLTFLGNHGGAGSGVFD